MSEQNLLPCPFCGASAETGEKTVEFWNYPPLIQAVVKCSNRDCPVEPEATGETLEEAAKAWNTRYNEGGKNG